MRQVLFFFIIIALPFAQGDGPVLAIEPSYGLPGTKIYCMPGGNALSSTDTLSCVFPGSVVPALFVNPAMVICQVPSIASQGAVPLTLRKGSATVLASADFFIIAPYSVGSFTPRAGSTSGGTSVSVGWVPPTLLPAGGVTAEVAFQDLLVPAVKDGAVQLRAVTPAGLCGMTRIGVALAGGPALFAPVLFAFYRVDSVMPGSGPREGGTHIEVSGDGFVDSVPYVCVSSGPAGGAASTAASFLHGKAVTCMVPRQPGSWVAVLAAGLGDDALPTAPVTGATAQFALYDPPVVDRVVPTVLTQDNTMFLTLVGSGFAGGRTVCQLHGAAILESVYASGNSTNVVCAIGANSVAGKGPFRLMVSLNDHDFSNTTFASLSISSCPPGTYSPTDASPCLPCPPGTASSTTGARSCSACDVGEFQAEGRTRCTACARGAMIVDRDNTAPSVSDCVCKVGFFSRRQTPGDACEDCPVGGHCAGGLSAPFPQPGWWSSKERPYEFHDCMRPNNCLGGAPERCSKAYGGFACLDCSPHHFRSVSTCLSCGGAAGTAVLAVTGLAVLAAIVYLLVRFAGVMGVGMASTLALVTRNLQFMHAVISSYSMWPAPLVTLVTVPGEVANLSVRLLGVECFVPYSFSQFWFLRMSVPWILIAVYGAIAMVARRWPRAGANSNNSSNSLVNGLLWCLVHLCFFPSVLGSLQIFSCHPHTRALLASPSITCGSAAWLRLAPVAGISLLLWLVVGPALVVRLLVKHRSEFNDEAFRARYGALYAMNSKRVPFFELVVAGEKLIMALVASLGSVDPFSQLCLFALFAFFFLTIHAYVRPFAHLRFAMGDLILNYSLLIFIGAGVFWSEAGQRFSAFVSVLGYTAVATSIVVSITAIIRERLKPIDLSSSSEGHTFVQLGDDHGDEL